MHQQAIAKETEKKLFKENQTVKGEEYHPSTLYNIAMIIQIYINERVDNTIKTMKDNYFHEFMSQIDIPNTFLFTGAVFNNCTISFK